MTIKHIVPSIFNPVSGTTLLNSESQLLSYDLNMNEKWKNISYQGCLLLIEGPSGGFYNIKDLFEQT